MTYGHFLPLCDRGVRTRSCHGDKEHARLGCRVSVGVDARGRVGEVPRVMCHCTLARFLDKLNGTRNGIWEEKLKGKAEQNPSVI